jgi:hypothetical protein
MNWPLVRPTVTDFNGARAMVAVPCEDGRTCMIEFEYDRQKRAWALFIAEEVLKESPQGVHAAVGLALMALAEHIDGPEEAT